MFVVAVIFVVVVRYRCMMLFFVFVCCFVFLAGGTIPGVLRSLQGLHTEGGAFRMSVPNSGQGQVKTAQVYRHKTRTGPSTYWTRFLNPSPNRTN